jgi:23S rRNA-/tRNA-specific pseudouridylate synthase
MTTTTTITTSFTYQQVKYFAPFFRDEEFSIKPKYLAGDQSLLDILSDMFRRKSLDDDGGKAETERYWRNIIDEQRRISVLLIFNDKIYRKYHPALQKPSKSPQERTDQFVTITDSSTVIPKDLLQHFWPPSLAVQDGEDDLTSGVRFKLRISGEHIHPRSVVVPYLPSIIFEDDNIIAVNKPFGIPSMGETNLSSSEWNSIVTWCRRKRSTTAAEETSNNENSQQSSTSNNDNGTVCDLMNRLDLDVSGLVLLGKSGPYRRKRGFAGDRKNEPGNNKHKTIKVYLAIIPKQAKAIRITTPRLGFDTRQAKAIMKNSHSKEEEGMVCKTSIYPLLELKGGNHSLVAICLEESGQRHQIRFHLSLIGAAIANDHLYKSDDHEETGKKAPVRRTGVGSSIVREETQKQPPSATSRPDNPQVQVNTINDEEAKTFLDTYVYTNGVTGFQVMDAHINNHVYTEPLMQRRLYPSEEQAFTDKLNSVFDFCHYCGKCQALQASPKNEDETAVQKATVIHHGIYLHSFRYFHATEDYPLFEATLPGQDSETGRYWWPVEAISRGCK